MKAKEKEDKHKIKLIYAVGLAKALKESKFKSFRDLALNTGFETAHIQRIAAGKVDVVLTTSVALAEGLGITYSELSKYYDQVTESDISRFLEDQTKRRKNSLNKPKKKQLRKKSKS
jgi:transcriptional regulator with XRE-family HTH domain